MKRIRRVSDSDESEAGGEHDQRDEVARDIFDGDDMDEPAPEQPPAQAVAAHEYGDLEADSESGKINYLIRFRILRRRSDLGFCRQTKAFRLRLKKV